MRFLILSLLFVSACGKDVKFTNQLESNSLVTQAEPVAVTQAGYVVKSTANPPGIFVMNGTTLKVSPFSSYLALNFISAQTEGVQVPVKIRGEVKGKEVYIKVIEQ